MENLLLLLLVGLCFELGHSHGEKWDVFSTRTLYAWAHSPPPKVVDNSAMNLAHNNRLCSAIHVNSLLRSGALFPSEDRIRQYSDLINRLAKANPTRDFFQSWSSNFPETFEDMVAQKGVQELFYLGQRYAQRFYRLLDESGDRLTFATTSEHPSIDSARFFFGGLKDRFSLVRGFSRTESDKTLLVHKTCSNYQKQLRDRTLLKEYDTFNGLLPFQKMFLTGFSKRFNVAVTADEVYLLNDLCAYGMIFNNTHTWCDLQSDTARLVLEYGLDLKEYYKVYYRSELNRGLTCPTIRELLTTLDSVIESDKQGENFTVGAFNFGSPEVFLSTLGALGLFADDEPLTASDMAGMSKRKFRSSQMAPFSANLAMVLYKCSNDNATLDSDYLLKIYVNEQSVEIPACGGATQCLYSQFRGTFSNSALECNITKTCSVSPTDGGGKGGEGGNGGEGGAGSLTSAWYLASLLLLFLALIV